MEIIQCVNKSVIKYIQGYGHQNPLPHAAKDEDITSQLVLYYIPFRLRAKLSQASLIGLPKDYLIPPGSPSELQTIVSNLCLEMENDHYQFFSGISSRLTITDDNLRATVLSVAGQIVNGGVNWGRIISLFTFCGVLSHYFIEQNKPLLVIELVSALTEFLNNNVMLWIKNNGGWDGLVRHFSNNKSRTWTDALVLGGICATTLFILSSH